MKAKINKINGLVYVTSEEEILNYNDFYLTNNKSILDFVLGDTIEGVNLLGGKKIIATNNKELPIQQLTDEEVSYCDVNEVVEYEELWVANSEPMFYKLLIPKDKASEIIDLCGGEDKFKELANLIPKEQECNNCEGISGFYLGTTCEKCKRPFRSVIKEQETIEQLAENLYGSLEIGIGANNRKIFSAGAKSQQPIIDQLKKDKDLMYSYKEVIYLIKEFKHYLSFGDEIYDLKWLEQFKK